MEEKISNNDAPKYKNLYVLGDSLSDTGALVGVLDALSFATTVKIDEPFYKGRSFSDGPVAAELLAEHLGVKEFKPGWSYSVFDKEHDQIGQNYAVEYATASECSDPAYKYFLNKFQLKNQLDALIKHHPDIGKEDLVFIMIGGNDLIVSSILGDMAEAEKTLDQAVSAICNTLKTLDEYGVQHVIVANGPSVGLLPALNKDAKAKEFAMTLTNYFNKKLTSGLEDIKKKYTSLDIKEFDLNFKLQSMIDEYKSKGLNYEDACISDFANEAHGGFKDVAMIFLGLIFEGTLDAHYNPGCSKETLKDYLFFDYVHPTKEAHYEVGAALYELIAT